MYGWILGIQLRYSSLLLLLLTGLNQPYESRTAIPVLIQVGHVHHVVEILSGLHAVLGLHAGQRLLSESVALALALALTYALAHALALANTLALTLALASAAEVLALTIALAGDVNLALLLRLLVGLVGLYVKPNGLALVQTPEALLLDLCVVYEDVLAVVVTREDSPALGSVEELALTAQRHFVFDGCVVWV